MAATLESFVNRLAAAEDAIQKLSDMLEVASVREIIVAVKTLELLENYKHVDGYDALVEKMVSKARTLMSSQLTEDDMMYVARAISFGTGIPLGSELRWQILNRDSHNIDNNGDVMVGERTLESFGTTVLETYYAAQ